MSAVKTESQHRISPNGSIYPIFGLHTMETNSLPLSEPTKSHEENDFGDEAPSAKRQRVSQACGPCRERKTRCDGRQPICVACEERGVAATCNFNYVRRRRTRHVPQLSPSVAIPSGAIRSQQQTAQHSFQSDPTVRRDAAQALSDLGSIQRPVISTSNTCKAVELADRLYRPARSEIKQPSLLSTDSSEWQTTSRVTTPSTVQSRMAWRKS